MNAPLEYLECAWNGNPFNSDAARAHSAYCGRAGDDIVRLLETAPPPLFARVAEASFRAYAQDDAFPCLGARSALHRQTYRFGAYAKLSDPAVTQGLARDLYAFVAERLSFDSAFTTYVAFFRDREIGSEAEFEGKLWRTLQGLHDLDRTFHPWDARVASDPEDAHFSFSIAGNAFFVVGLHPQASRPARRFAWPTLVFNAHEQFDRLRSEGKFERLKREIRKRDLALSGSANPNLSDYGKNSEALQYSGRQVEGDWKCPFIAKP